MRLLIADRNPKAGTRLAQKFATVPGVRVVGLAEDLSATYDIAEHKLPNLVLVDTYLARQPEFEVLCLLFRGLSLPCVLVASGSPISEAERELAAHYGFPIKSASQSAESLLSVRSLGQNGPSQVRAIRNSEPNEEFDDGLILIGASTGGVDALIRVLSDFPSACPPTLIVQHTGPQFTEGFARLVDGHIAPKVSEAQAGLRPTKGNVLIAPGGDAHLILTGSGRSVRCGFDTANPVQGHRPSVDVLFESAVPFAHSVAAAILTGMGRDGAEGLLALRKAGAKTFGQDKQSSVVYGMPSAAFERGAVGKQLPLDAIGRALLRARRRAI